MPEKKLIPFATEYEISNNGEVYSFKTNKYLKKRIIKGKSNSKYYYSYDLSKFGKHLITRLVMFCFGNHNYSKIEDMPKIILKDKDLENLHISNLKFVSQSEMNKIYGIKPTRKEDQNQKIKSEEIKTIFKLRAEGKTLKEIGLIYNTSEMSVHRFIQKYKTKTQI